MPKRSVLEGGEHSSKVVELLAILRKPSFLCCEGRDIGRGVLLLAGRDVSVELGMCVHDDEDVICGVAAQDAKTNTRVPFLLVHFHGAGILLADHLAGFAAGQLEVEQQRPESHVHPGEVWREGEVAVHHADGWLPRGVLDWPFARAVTAAEPSCLGVAAVFGH